jgi:hypothetical protein
VLAKQPWCVMLDPYLQRAWYCTIFHHTIGVL